MAGHRGRDRSETQDPQAVHGGSVADPASHPTRVHLGAGGLGAEGGRVGGRTHNRLLTQLQEGGPSK